MTGCNKKQFADISLPSRSFTLLNELSSMTSAAISPSAASESAESYKDDNDIDMTEAVSTSSTNVGASPSSKSTSNERPTKQDSRLKQADEEETSRKLMAVKTMKQPGYTTTCQRERRFVTHDYIDHSEAPPSNLMESKINENPSLVDSGKKKFPILLHRVLDQLEAENKAHYFGWMPHGRSFMIRNRQMFIKEILPAYFGMAKGETSYCSFTRQVNKYGFRRLTKASGKDQGSYYHECFIRGQVFLTFRMKGMKINGKGFKYAASPETEPNFYKMPFCAPSRNHIPAVAMFGLQSSVGAFSNGGTNNNAGIVEERENNNATCAAVQMLTTMAANHGDVTASNNNAEPTAGSGGKSAASSRSLPFAQAVATQMQQASTTNGVQFAAPIYTSGPHPRVNVMQAAGVMNSHGPAAASAMNHRVMVVPTYVVVDDAQAQHSHYRLVAAPSSMIPHPFPQQRLVRPQQIIMPMAQAAVAPHTLVATAPLRAMTAPRKGQQVLPLTSGPGHQHPIVIHHGLAAPQRLVRHFAPSSQFEQLPQQQILQSVPRGANFRIATAAPAGAAALAYHPRQHYDYVASQSTYFDRMRSSAAS